MASKKKRPNPPPPPQRKAPPRTRPVAGARESQREAAARTAARETLRRRLVAGGLVVVAAVAVGAYVVNNGRADARLDAQLTAGSCRTDTEADPTAGAPGNHVPSPTYAVDPPAGGNHLGTGAASAGTYAGAQVPSDGLVVHSLEHGYVVLWHQPGIPEADKARLKVLQEDNGTDVIVVERASLSVPVAATAWGQRLLCGAFEPEVLQRFVDERVGDGPEDVPRT